MQRAWLWLIRPLGAILLVIGLAYYFIGVPHADGFTLVPGTRFHNLIGYVALDIGLVVLALRLRTSTDSPLWRSAYGWFACGFALGFVVDALDLATRIGPLPWVDFGTPLDLLVSRKRSIYWSRMKLEGPPHVAASSPTKMLSMPPRSVTSPPLPVWARSASVTLNSSGKVHQRRPSE